MSTPVFSQIPVELYLGSNKSSIDLMFFKYFKNNKGENTEFLFFSRERAVIENEKYDQAGSVQFGFTEALSYNNQY